ncbi:Transcriptional regulator PadR-like family protein [Streptosporangium canum]|uniref:Transcriptional regulator PadR-like family protein n=1 Tax=Streptosporangium canum TaxID=324952 RepID=A0A1I4DGC7_9ACTN|nr:PadR family transcriptional regulator [Streptosporangium canum]SFK92265.1 Transcriptional regulator PadR-like family protein [Streptosporangium canum]
MTAVVRLTLPTRLILNKLLEAQEREMYGFELRILTGLPGPTIHQILARLEARGWATSRWEDRPPGGRPLRRYYRLTPDGAAQARTALARRGAVSDSPPAPPAEHADSGDRAPHAATDAPIRNTGHTRNEETSRG